MCLGIPGQVETVSGRVATVDFGDVSKQVRLDVVDEPVEPGDYVLNHAGFAIRKIPDAEALATIETYESLLSAEDRRVELGEDVDAGSEASKSFVGEGPPVDPGAETGEDR
jgi:hydrogenase expression/formation protein HypC